MNTLSIGTNVIYGTSGVCTVSDVRDEDFGTGKKKYYVLRPVEKYNSTDIFVPADNENLMGKIKRILSPEEIYSLIEVMPDESMEWICDNRERGLAFGAIIAGGDRLDLIRLTKAVYAKKKELAKDGKKIAIADERMMRAAEKMLFDEFAAVLEIDRSEVLPFITKQIKCGKKDG